MTSGLFLGHRNTWIAFGFRATSGSARLGVTAREIDAADGATTRVRTECSTGVIELRIENIFAMTARPNAIVDNESQHDFARDRLAVGNIFTK